MDSPASLRCTSSMWNTVPRRSDRARSKPDILTYEQTNSQASVPKPMGRTEKRQMERELKKELKKYNKLVQKHHLSNAQSNATVLEEEYDAEMAPFIAMIINDINNQSAADGAQFAQQHLLNKGLKVFGDQGAKASTKELDQLHLRE